MWVFLAFSVFAFGAFGMLFASLQVNWPQMNCFQERAVGCPHPPIRGHRKMQTTSDRRLENNGATMFAMFHRICAHGCSWDTITARILHSGTMQSFRQTITSEDISLTRSDEAPPWRKMYTDGANRPHVHRCLSHSNATLPFVHFITYQKDKS